MEASTEAGGEELLWVRSGRSSRNFELRAGESVRARLEWSDRARALGVWAECRYQFKRNGWWRQRVIVYDGAATSATEPLATFAPLDGALSFADSRRFAWTKPKRLTNERVWVDSAGATVAQFSPSRRGTSVAISATAAQLPELPLLALLGQFLMVSAARDADDATTAAITVTMYGGAG